MFTDAQVDAALEALSEPERFAGAERQLAPLVPQLQRILTYALEEGGWFGDAHHSEVKKAASAGDEMERTMHIRTLLAEETRMAMLVGVAVGWQLAHELKDDEGDT